MKETYETIVFFGSGPVAAESLRLLSRSFNIEAVVTKPTTEREMVAVAGESPVFTVTTRKELDALVENKRFSSRVGVLIDFGIIVSQSVIDYFPLGIVNSHFSLLPEWRGADPITFAILSGQKQTGVSLMLLVPAMDEGPVLSFGIQELDDEITTPVLTQKLIHLSYALLEKELPRYINGESKAVSQDELHKMVSNYPNQPSYSRKLSKDDGILDFTKPPEYLEREIRAFIEWPKSRTNFGNLEVIVTSARVSDVSGEPGSRRVIDKKPAIACQRGSLVITTIKPAGKKEMTGEAFLAGYKKLFLDN